MQFLGHDMRHGFRRLSAVVRPSITAFLISGCIVVILSSVQTSAWQRQPASSPSPAPQAVFEKYCIACHNQTLRTAGLERRPSGPQESGFQCGGVGKSHREAARRFDAAAGNAAARCGHLSRDSWLRWKTKSTARGRRNPNPGRIGAVHRLNRTEYNNAIRDLFALDLDVKPLLPGDDTADGSFDNFADTLSISTAHLERYHVGRSSGHAAGDGSASCESQARDVRDSPARALQEDRQSEDLPFGSRGGMAIHYDFPVDGEYLIKVRLQRQYQDYLKGMGWPQQLDIRLDGKLLKRFTVGGASQGPAGGGQLRRRR